MEAQARSTTRHHGAQKRLAQCFAIASDDLQAWIHPLGAELCALQSSSGHALLWSGDARWWDRCAPILFPIIGRARDGRVQHQGRSYPMPPHGFAMHQPFELVQSDEQACVWRLAACAATRQQYPFDFALQLHYRVTGRQLALTVQVENTGNQELPFALGLHPGLRWPIRAPTRDGHSLSLEADEPGPVRRRAPSGLLGPLATPLPLVGRQLPLNDALFDAGVHVLEHATSRRVVYADTIGPLVTLSWSGLPHLALWSLPGAPFVCMEPWGALPELDDQPYGPSGGLRITRLAPRDLWSAEMALEVDPSLCAERAAQAPCGQSSGSMAAS